jgi:RNA recognition motif-containing protein
MKEDDLRDLFKIHGAIKKMDIKSNYGFIEFEDYRDAEEAIDKKNGKVLEGDRRLTVKLSDPEKGKKGP